MEYGAVRVIVEEVSQSLEDRAVRVCGAVMNDCG